MHMCPHVSTCIRYMKVPVETEDFRLLRNRIVSCLLRVVEIEPGSS